MDSVLLWDSREKPSQLLDFMRERAVEPALSSLLCAIASDPLWEQLAGVRLVARAHPAPLIAAFGRFTPFARARLQNLSTLLVQVIEHHRYVDYGDAERLSACLAQRLLQRFSRDEIRTFRFAAVPRGGHIVLGMLAYALDLEPDQLCDIDTGLSEHQPSPVVIVDDCAISGVRLQQYLRRANGQGIVFASLLAPAGFREALVSREGLVLECLSAETLDDLAPQRFGDGYAEWYRERTVQMGKYGYWVGVTPHFAFAWSEPQTKYWNADARRFEAGWRVMPAHLCLAHRHRRSASLMPERISICNTPHGYLRLSDRVLWVEVEERVAVALMPKADKSDATCFCLEGSAAAMWRAGMASGTREAVVTELQRLYPVERHVLQRDLEGFIASLVSHGLAIDTVRT